MRVDLSSTVIDRFGKSCRFGSMKRLIGFLFVALAVGCGSVGLPKRLTGEERSIAGGPPLPYRVAVDRHHGPAYSDSLIRALRRTRAFAEVDYADRLSSPPHLIARVEDEIRGRAIIPVWTIVTLGIVPTVTNENFGESFSLRSVDGSEGVVRIAERGKSRIILGWIGLIAALLPDRSVVSTEGSSRYVERLRYALLRERAAIDRLAERSTR